MATKKSTLLSMKTAEKIAKQAEERGISIQPKTVKVLLDMYETERVEQLTSGNPVSFYIGSDLMFNLKLKFWRMKGQANIPRPMVVMKTEISDEIKKRTFQKAIYDLTVQEKLGEKAYTLKNDEILYLKAKYGIRANKKDKKLLCTRI